jgi:hypothetical protein
VLLGEGAMRENHIAHPLVVVPRQGIAGVHRERVDLNRGRNRKAGTEAAKVIAGDGTQFEIDTATFRDNRLLMVISFCCPEAGSAGEPTD